jgi:nicotinamidase-related amidase
MAAWDDVLPEEDRLVFEAGGWGSKVGYGSRPALLVIDVNYNFVGDRPEPILDSVQRWRFSCGERGWDGIAHLAKLIDACRSASVPIFYTTMERRADGLDQGLSSRAKTTRSTEDNDVAGSLGNQIVAEIAPGPRDIVIVKPKPSIFHGTPLLDYLIELGTDTLIVTGTTTSGCVRAAVVDAVQYNFRAIVPEECVWDRGLLSHKVNLFDIQMKYGDVNPTDDVIRYVQGLKRDGMAR